MTDEEIVSFVIDRFEKGFVNDPDDRGGATKYGVTQATLGRARALGRDATIEEVRNMHREEAVSILLQDYVRGVGFDRIANWRLRFAVVDYGMTSGPERSAQVLQRILSLTTDGTIGPVSLARINALSPDETPPIIAKHLADRIRFIGALVTRKPTQSRFDAGWSDRIATVLELVTAA